MVVINSVFTAHRTAQCVSLQVRRCVLKCLVSLLLLAWTSISFAGSFEHYLLSRQHKMAAAHKPSAQTRTYALITPHEHPWSIEVGIGFSYLDEMYGKDGETSISRIALGKIFAADSTMPFGTTVFYGVELGTQNGTFLRGGIPQPLLDELGSLQVKGYLKPQLDLLFTVRVQRHRQSRFGLFAKAGMVYRHLEFSRASVNDRLDFDPKIQVGFSVRVNPLTRVFAAYQRVCAPKFDYAANFDEETIHFHSIPYQQSVLLGISLELT